MARALVSVDEGLGGVLDALSETGQLDNTFVLFAGDNGYFYGEHGLGDKRRAYEEGIRVPLLVRYPKFVRAGLTPSQMVLNVDVAPTFLELAGLKRHPQMHGRSLLPLLRGGEARWRSSILTEYFKDPPFPATQPWQSVRTPGWKLIHYPGLQDADELYHLATDPLEMKNVIRDASNAGTMQQLRRELQRQLKATGAA
jgi:arylsulfatase A-like enzyme